MRQAAHLRREDVGRDGDDPLAPQGADGSGLIVVAGPDGEILGAEAPGPLDVSQVSRRLLDADDVRVFRQGGVRLRGDGNPGAGGDAVQDNGKGDRIGDGPVVPEQPRLAGFVVVGGNHQKAIRPLAFRLLGKRHGVFRGVGPGPGDNRDSPAHVPDAEGDGFCPFPVGHGACLAGGAADHHGVRPVFQLKVQQVPQGVQVHAAFLERCDDGHCGTYKDGVLHSRQLLS